MTGRQTVTRKPGLFVGLLYIPRQLLGLTRAVGLTRMDMPNSKICLTKVGLTGIYEFLR